MTTTIGNLRNTKEGRRLDRASALGNPFDLINLKDSVMRLNVCSAYDGYFNLVVGDVDQPNTGMEPMQAVIIISKKYGLTISPTWKRPSRDTFMRELESIGSNDKLLCWCHPLPCHVQTIKIYIDRRTLTLSGLNRLLSTDS